MNIPLKDKHPLLQLVAFIGLSIISSIIIMLIGLIGGIIFSGGELLDSLMQNTESEQYIAYLKFLQLLSHLGMFIIPAIIFARLAGGKILQYYTLKNSDKALAIFISILIVIFAQPLISLLTEWNAGISLPEGLSETESWMKNSEAEATRITELFLNTKMLGGLFFNIFLIALIPAIGEELVFRGILQKLLQKWIKNPWIAIFITAFVFSSFHMQFYGFFPRFILGFVLGYLFYRSGKLWISILVHFVNNAGAVILYYLFANGSINTHPDLLFNFNNNIPVLILSIFLFAGSLIIFHNIFSKKTT